MKKIKIKLKRERERKRYGWMTIVTRYALLHFSSQILKIETPHTGSDHIGIGASQTQTNKQTHSEQYFRESRFHSILFVLWRLGYSDMCAVLVLKNINCF